LNHNFFSEKPSHIGPFFPYTLPVLIAAIEQLNIKYSSKDLLAGRAFLQLPNGPSTTNTPHVDTDEPHWVFLYYVNDSDGDTVFYEKKSSWNTDSKKYGDVDYVEVGRVTPLQGRCVIFDGRNYHSSSSPTKNKRCILNFNYRK
jgi:hypothetical protein